MVIDYTLLATKAAIQFTNEVFKVIAEQAVPSSFLFKKINIGQSILRRSAKKYANHIEGMYNHVKIFGMDKPIPLRQIFVKVKVLDKKSSTKIFSALDLQKFAESEELCLDINRINDTQDIDLKKKSQQPTNYSKSEDAVKVVNGIKHLVVLGSPGSGKTTLLKHIALIALDKKLSIDKLPIFVSIKDWCDSKKTLYDFILEQLDICGFNENDSKLFLEKLLTSGKALILLDGLDEAGQEVLHIANKIKIFNNKYNDNNFIVTCRIKAYEYVFEKFTETEIAAFDNLQINTFIKNWFSDQEKIAKSCWEQLNQRKARPIKELAHTPLLLTLICISYGETLSFPKNRSDLYKEAIDALLKKWDSSRGIKRNDAYGLLTLGKKEILLSHIATKFFQQDLYFFPRKLVEKELEDFFAKYEKANHLFDRIEGDFVLNSIESQHGILIERSQGVYSFSHLTLQEYFTAKYIVDNEARGTIKKLVDIGLNTNKWREVILLAAGMLVNSDELLKTIRRKIGESYSIELNNFFTKINNVPTIKNYAIKTIGNISAICIYIVFCIAKKHNITCDIYMIYSISLLTDETDIDYPLINTAFSTLTNLCLLDGSIPRVTRENFAYISKETNHIGVTFQDHSMTKFLFEFISKGINDINIVTDAFDISEFTKIQREILLYLKNVYFLIECMNISCSCHSKLILTLSNGLLDEYDEESITALSKSEYLFI